MIYGSVCSGIEAATVAWHPLGWKPAFFAEIEKYPSAVLKHWYPNVPNHGDFTTIQRGDYEPIDLLVGGTPCQDFSVAGLRAGVDGDRGNLTLEFLRLADRLRPRWVVWENVPGVLSSTSHRAPDPCPPPDPLDLESEPEEVVIEDEYDASESHAFNSFVAGLSELGYGWAMRVLDAQYAGVPQRRRRVFVVGYLGDWNRAAAVLFERHSLSGHPAPRREAREVAAGGVEVGPSGGRLTDVTPTLDARCKDGFIRNQIGAGVLHASAATYWDGTDVADTLDASNASKQQAMPEKRRFQAVITHALRADGFDASEDGTGRGTPLVPVEVNAVMTLGHTMHNGLGVYETDIANTLESVSSSNQAVAFRTNSAGQVDFQGDKAAALTTMTDPSTQFIAFSSKDYGADAGELAPTLRAMGHDGSHANAGGQVAVMMLAIRGRGDSHDLEYREDGTANAVLTPNGGRGGIGVGAVAIPAIGWSEELTASVDLAGTVQRGGDGGRHEGVMTPTMAVRRLTPRECERLQGFPDDYTKIGETTADGPRYKALGNSMAVPCMQWIGERIAMVDALLAT